MEEVAGLACFFLVVGDLKYWGARGARGEDGLHEVKYWGARGAVFGGLLHFAFGVLCVSNQFTAADSVHSPIPLNFCTRQPQPHTTIFPTVTPSGFPVLFVCPTPLGVRNIKVHTVDRQIDPDDGVMRLTRLVCIEYAFISQKMFSECIGTGMYIAAEASFTNNIFVC